MAQLPSSKKRRLPARQWLPLRRMILARDRHTCVHCGRNAVLEVHHRDGNHANNQLENLETVCKTCHIAIHKPTVAPEVQAWQRLVDYTRK